MSDPAGLRGIGSSAVRVIARTWGTVRLRSRWHTWQACRALARERLRLNHDSVATNASSMGRLRTRTPVASCDAWRGREDIAPVAPARVGVVVHAFYPELLPDLVDRIARMPVDYDLWITNATGGNIELPAEIGRVRHVRVLDVENHGRDILPLVCLVNAGLLDDYAVVLKVHTKRSGWRAGHPTLSGDGDRWRENLLSSVLGDQHDLATILSAFAEQPRLGLVTADESVLGPAYWGANRGRATRLLLRAGVVPDPDPLSFAAGSIYWARASLLQRLRALALTADDFEPEQGQADGTTAHAVERVLGILAATEKLTIAGRSALSRPSDPESYLQL